MVCNLFISGYCLAIVQKQYEAEDLLQLLIAFPNPT